MEFQGIDPLKHLIEMVEGIKKEITDLQTKADLRAYTLKEIAEGFGYSVQSLRNKPWKIPNYGRPDVAMYPGKRFYSTIANWYAIPEDERRFKWESMSSSERLDYKKPPEKAKAVSQLRNKKTANSNYSMRNALPISKTID